MKDPIRPKDPAEAVALYRAQIVGPVVRRALERGDLAVALTELSKTRFCPPRSHGGRTYSVATLERWYYAFKEGGLDALRPKTRSDRGRGRELTDEQKKLLLDVRREHPEVSVAMILRTLELDGRVERGAITASTLRRFFAEQGLDRVAFSGLATDGRQRLRWQAEHPGALWQGDVCHASPIIVGGKSVPARIHALLDDASRYVVAIEARHQEREVDMLAVLIRALRRFGAPDALYLDNGATYRGETLSLACARLGTALVHAKPYDAPARGKMERFWRTLREQCLVFAKDLGSLHDLNVRILAWLDEHYHKAPHGGLMGKAPADVFTAAPAKADDLDEAKLRRALTVRELTYCHNATLGRRDFYRQLSLALGLSPSATAAAVFYAVAQHVEDMARNRRAHPVFLLDEAHLLHQDTLDHLHILLNYEWDSKALLSLVLVGLSDFEDRLRVRRNRSLASRIHRRLVIDPLTPEDTADYLRARLARAGCNRDVFASDAVTILHEATAGTLRDLDRLATSCLRIATRKKRKSIERDVVSRVVKASTSAEVS